MAEPLKAKKGTIFRRVLNKGLGWKFQDGIEYNTDTGITSKMRMKVYLQNHNSPSQ